MNIVLADKLALDSFFVYLEKQSAENGNNGSPFFRPISRKLSEVGAMTREIFIRGVSTPRGEPGWRTLWLAKDDNGEILGHIDIRPHDLENTFHRVLLGMGVNSSNRRAGVGENLVKHVLQYCEADNTINWLDLSVLSENFPAKGLYQKLGFREIGNFQDMYRIDGESVSEIYMSKSVS